MAKDLELTAKAVSGEGFLILRAAEDVILMTDTGFPEFWISLLTPEKRRERDILIGFFERVQV